MSITLRKDGRFWARTPDRYRTSLGLHATKEAAELALAEFASPHLEPEWSSDRFEAVWRVQGGRCAMPDCKRKLSKKRDAGENHACRDHCHTTDVPRGLLCHQCNVALGFFETSAHRYPVFAAYLASHRLPKAA